MILDEISLTNFGLYAGSQRIALTPPCPSKPIVLFGGLNGYGKTTLLEAIQLCLYGAHAKTTTRGRQRYSDYLSRCIYDQAEERLSSIQITFRHHIDGEEVTYKIRRRWRVKDRGCREEFDVLRNDRLIPALAENWASQVEDFLPANIAHLFLFDGEQIERYASIENSEPLIRSAIQNLLGLDIVDRLEKDIQIFERRKKLERLDEEDLLGVKRVEEELNQLESKIQESRQERASLRNSIDRSNKTLDSLNHQFQKLGGNLYEQRREIEAKVASIDGLLKTCEERLRNHATGSLPLLLIQNTLKQGSVRDQEECKITKARQLLSVLEERDNATIDYMLRQKVTTETRSLLRNYLESDRKKLSSRARQKTSLNLSEIGRISLSVLLAQFDEIDAMVQEELSEHANLIVELKHAMNLLESVPDRNDIADLLKRRVTIQHEVKELHAEENSLVESEERLVRKYETTKRSLETLLDAKIKHQQRLEDRDRILSSASRVCGTLTKFRHDVVEKHIEKIEHFVLESYQHLLRKNSLVTRLSIDSGTYSLSLFGRQGEILRTETLSAGERQLLGIALLWGLARVSGRPLPTAIDTPMGRLDRGHRFHFVERYLPFASHQTLVFSTDEEIVGEYLDRLSPWIGRTYILNYDNSLHRTVVEPGYFQGELIHGN